MTTTESSIFFSLFPVSESPFSHVLQDNYLEPDLFLQLKDSFPQCPKSTGPTGYSLYWGDPDYATLLASNPAWKTFFDRFHSQQFVNYCIEQFQETYSAKRCRIDLSRAVYVPYQESREDKERRHIQAPRHEPHELWVRLDIHQGFLGYGRKVHLDHRRRLVTLLIYFNGADEISMNGGELWMHSRKLGFLHPKEKVIQSQNNRMVCFPCSGDSYHSVARVLSQSAPRNFVQVTLSSSQDAWH